MGSAGEMAVCALVVAVVAWISLVIGGFLTVTGIREIGYRFFAKKTWRSSRAVRGLAVGLLLTPLLFAIWTGAYAFEQRESVAQTREIQVPKGPSPLPSPKLVPPVPGFDRYEPPLAAIYASWYGYDYITGECRGGFNDSMHWGTFSGTVGEPEKGYYCSADPEVIRWQLDQLEDMGVQALFVSWWGWGDTDLDGDVEGHSDMYMNRGVKALLDKIVSGNRNIKVAIIAEPFTLTQAGIHPNELRSAQKQMVLDWLWDNYYGKYPEQMFTWEGQPLLITFDPMRLPADSRYTIEPWTGRARDSITESEGYEWFFAPPQDVMEGMSDDGVAFVYPRFDEWYLKTGGASWITWEPRRINPDLDSEFYIKQWKTLIRNRDRIRLIVLYSWNLYGEQALCEPSWSGPFPTGNQCVDLTKEYYQRFLAAIEPTP